MSMRVNHRCCCKLCGRGARGGRVWHALLSNSTEKFISRWKTDGRERREGQNVWQKWRKWEQRSASNYMCIVFVSVPRGGVIYNVARETHSPLAPALTRPRRELLKKIVDFWRESKTPETTSPSENSNRSKLFPSQGPRRPDQIK